MSEAADISRHVLEEVRALRDEVNANSREQRIVIDKHRERHAHELTLIHDKISELDVKMTERNEQRASEHRALAQRVTMYAAFISGVVTIVVGWVREFFFR